MKLFRTTSQRTAISLAALTVATAGLLASPASAAPGCIERTGNTPWGAGGITACANGGSGNAKGYTTDKAADGQCVRWRIVWQTRAGDRNQYTPWACPDGQTTKFDKDAEPSGVTGVGNAFLERVKV
ncbi:MAG: hypothetical protein ACRDTT_09635 [Pseudonocardiaceae bacterium]